MKYFRVYSDNFDGQVFEEPAFKVLKTQLCNGDTSMYDVKEISIVEVEDHEKIHTVGDLPRLGFNIELQAAEEASEIDEDDEVEELTEQSDDEFFDTANGESDFDDEGYF